MKAYLYLIKMNILQALAYRFEVIATVLCQFIVVLASAFIWKSAYIGEETVGGVNERQMLVYSVVSVLMNCFFVHSVEWKIRDGVRRGTIALDYLKPVNLFLMYFSEDVGGAAASLLLKFLSVFLFSCAFIVVPVPHSFLHFLLFLFCCLISFFILWIISAIFGLLNFWFVDFGPLGSVKDMIILFLSGSIVPIWFFPDGIQTLLSFFPFIYLYQFPISIYIGNIDMKSIGAGMLIQIAWAAGFFGFFLLMNYRSKKHLLVQGG